MATIDEVKHLFEGTRIEVLEKAEDHFNLEYRENKFYILDSEIDTFISLKDVIKSEPSTSIFYPCYYEHLVELNKQYPMMRSRLFVRRDEIELINQDNTLSITFGKASTTYLIAKLIQGIDPINETLRRRLHFFRTQPNEEQIPHIREILGRFLTICVKATANTSFCKQHTKLREIAEAGLFNLAYGYGEGFVLAQNWERGYERLARRKNESVQFPRRLYNKELTSYYQLAVSSDSNFLGYIALYKIIEFFFVSSVQKELHRRMIDKLVTPNFSHKKDTQLRQLAAIIRKHDQKMDEQRSLRCVLEKNFDPNDLITWVNDYESESTVYYSDEQEIFGKKLKIDMNPEKIHASLAERIYHIRNALVHHKEGETARFIPFEGQEQIIENEIPILLFLAESLILKTGNDF